MITRTLSSYAKAVFRQYPVITITGPRQSGKTTLARNAFKDLPYFNLENMETRSFAADDPQGFLNQCPDGAVIDEIQHVPGITSWIQVRTDESGREGMYVLTGSRQFEIMESVSQSLAGRTAILRLLPFSIEEMGRSYGDLSVDDFIYKGFYPRIYDKGLDPSRALSDYYTTYIERDVRSISVIHNLALFQKFVRLCAGRVGQLLNYSSLASDTGISHSTTREWMSILQASYTVFLLEPYHANISKRIIKSPKLYFYDVGLAAHLLGIEKTSHVRTHPLRGSLFENLVLMEILKFRYNRGKRANLFFYRDSSGNEVDILYCTGHEAVPIEIKSGETLNDDFFSGFRYFRKHVSPTPPRQVLVYGGKRTENRNSVEVTDIMGLTKILRSIEET